MTVIVWTDGMNGMVLRMGLYGRKAGAVVMYEEGQFRIRGVEVGKKYRNCIGMSKTENKNVEKTKCLNTVQ